MNIRTRAGIAMTALVAAIGITTPPASASFLLKFVNENPDYNDNSVFVTFGGANPPDGAINGGSAIQSGVSYSLATLSSGVTINEFNSGRIFVSLGSGLTSATASNGYAANFANPNLPDYYTRWDKIELTFDRSTQTGGANLTAQDFFSVPLQITTNGQSPAKLTWRSSTSSVMQTLGQLSQFALTEPNQVFSPYGAVATIQPTQPAQDGVAVPGVALPVVRVISPATVTAKADGTTVYPSLASYIAYLRNNGGQPIAAEISGHNGTINNGTQIYNLAVTIANKTSVVGGTTVNPGDVVFQGSITNGLAGPVSTVAIIRAANLTDSNIYGAAAPFEIVQGADTNGVLTRAVADYLSALNFGLVGSAQPNPNNPGHTLGDSPSWTWYGNNPSGVDGPKLPITDAFAAAQPSQPFYNVFASELIGPTDAYGFAYNDRLQLPLADIFQNTTLTVTVLPETPLKGGPAPVSEPQSLFLMAGALAAFGAIRPGRRRRR